MSDPAFVGVDWGTSNARFMLISPDGKLLAERAGPGIAALKGVDAIEVACGDGVNAWLAAYPDVPIFMCGMVGSNIGWQLAPYVATPADVAAIGGHLLRIERRNRSYFIIPGVETCRFDGAPDLMRGEETQVFGAFGDDDGLACLPGTHCKWVTVSGGRITQFHTALTGELMALIGLHSILLNPRGAPHAALGAAFDTGVRAAHAQPVGLETLLFTVRSLQIKGALAGTVAADYLAGLCIGSDIKSALAIHTPRESIKLIGASALTDLYARALDIFGHSSSALDGRDAVVQGLRRIYLQWRRI